MTLRRMPESEYFLRETMETTQINRKIGIYERIFKRFFDILLSGLALLVLSPLLLVLAILVRVKLGSPVLFRQERPGKHEKIFTLYKFRSMSDARDENGKLLSDEARLGKFGRLLRSTSLDELPELWNIFRGDMSIVGPRPLLVEYLPYYTEQEHHRHDVRPGLTGLAQINGRNNLSWDKKFAHDLKYVQTISFTADVKILLLTVRQVVHMSDIQANTQIIEGNLAELRKSGNLL